MFVGYAPLSFILSIVFCIGLMYLDKKAAIAGERPRVPPQTPGQSIGLQPPDPNLMRFWRYAWPSTQHPLCGRSKFELFTIVIHILGARLGDAKFDSALLGMGTSWDVWNVCGMVGWIGLTGG